MTLPLEKIFKRNLLVELRKRGGFWYSTEMRGLSGIPDIIGCVCGMFIGIECKRSNKHLPTAKQQHTLNKIKINGGFGEVCNPQNRKELLSALDNFIKDKHY
jgi:hypothetical protein